MKALKTIRKIGSGWLLGLVLTSLLAASAMAQDSDFDDVYATPSERRARNAQLARQKAQADSLKAAQEARRREAALQRQREYDELQAQKNGSRPRIERDEDDDFYYTRQLRRFDSGANFGGYYSTFAINPLITPYAAPGLFYDPYWGVWAPSVVGVAPVRSSIVIGIGVGVGPTWGWGFYRPWGWYDPFWGWYDPFWGWYDPFFWGPRWGFRRWGWAWGGWYDPWCGWGWGPGWGGGWAYRAGFYEGYYYGSRGWSGGSGGYRPNTYAPRGGRPVYGSGGGSTGGDGRRVYSNQTGADRPNKTYDSGGRGSSGGYNQGTDSRNESPRSGGRGSGSVGPSGGRGSGGGVSPNSSPRPESPRSGGRGSYNPPSRQESPSGAPQRTPSWERGSSGSYGGSSGGRGSSGSYGGSHGGSRGSGSWGGSSGGGGSRSGGRGR